MAQLREDNFWKTLLEEPKWVSQTSYTYGAPPAPTRETEGWYNERPWANLRSTDRFETKKEAEKKTKAVVEILSALGFLDLGFVLVSHEMKWKYPRREWVEKIMLNMEGTEIVYFESFSNVTPRAISMPSMEWLAHLGYWKKDRVTAPETETTLEGEMVDGEEEGQVENDETY